MSQVAFMFSVVGIVYTVSILVAVLEAFFPDEDSED